MKVYISKYRNHWLSPYTILEKIFFWKEIDYDDPFIDKWSDRLDPYCIGLMKFLDFFHPRINYIKIDKYDTWDMDKTLSPIILAMLNQLKGTKHGAPCVADEDVPEELKSTSAPPKENEWDTDGNWFKRWDWVMDQMIWSFEQLVDDTWQDQYHGKCTITGGCGSFDREGYIKHSERINNGLRLFGVYYTGLWD